MTIKEITLLSIEEYVKYKPIIPLVEDRWWLRSPDKYLSSVAAVRPNGVFAAYGFNVNGDNIAVRPALEFNLDTSDNLFWYKPEKIIGTKIKYGKYQWTILDAEFGELYALCDAFIAKRRFDPKSDDWNTSELKQWLEAEFLALITT